MKPLIFAYCLSLISFLLFAGFFHPTTELDQDLGRHILTGNIILETLTVPKINLFSYTHPNQPFINTHWLSEIIFSQIVNILSFPGLFALKLILVFSAFIPLCVFSWNRSKNAFALLIVSFLYINVLFERTSIRPELFSFLLTSLFILILYKNREKFTRLIFVLPFLELFWVNLHIYFFIGIIICGLFFIDELIRQRKKIILFIKHRCPLPFSIIIIGLITGGVFLASFANPNVIQGSLYPLFVFNNYGYSIEENQNIWFLWEFSKKTTIVYFVLSVILLFTSLVLTAKKTKPIDWLLAIVFSFLSYSTIRNFSLFVFTTFIPSTIAFSLVTDSLYKNKLLKKPNMLLLFCILIAAAFIFNNHQIIEKKGFGYGVVENGKGAIDFFVKNKLKGPIFNNFDIGSYIDYRLYPKEKVFVDGRPEAYPSTFFQKIYIPMQEDEKMFERIYNQYKFKSIVFSHTDQTPWARNFIKFITGDPKWAIVYLDSTFVILVPITKENEALINKYKITENNPSYKISTPDPASYIKLLLFYQQVAWEKPQEILFQKMLEKDPNSCTALSFLSSLLEKRKDPAAPIFINRYEAICTK